MSRIPALHICNTFFENELDSGSKRPLIAWMRSHAVVRQLQTLPLLYAPHEDMVLVSDLPQNPDPRLRLLDAPLPTGRSTGTIECWGASKAIAAWAEEKGIPYSMPDWNTVQTVNSKTFSFSHSPTLPLASLLYNEKETLLWLEKTPGKKVLKTPFGTAGRGLFHVPGPGNLPVFLKREFGKGHPLIGEPWVERTLDFSTQWKNGTLLGATIFENAPNGSYRATLAGPNIFGPYEWALEEHLAIVRPLLEKIEKLGFFGHLGIDAYIYLWEGKETLQPVVEINGRKTMSWAALSIQKLKSPNQPLRFSFSPELGITLAMG